MTMMTHGPIHGNPPVSPYGTPICLTAWDLMGFRIHQRVDERTAVVFEFRSELGVENQPDRFRVISSKTRAGKSGDNRSARINFQ